MQAHALDALLELVVAFHVLNRRSVLGQLFERLALDRANDGHLAIGLLYRLTTGQLDRMNHRGECHDADRVAE